jgi:putative tricarboxylic transport membrane protein
MAKVDYIIFVCILVLAGVYAWATEKLPSLEIGDPLGPKAFPRLLTVGLIVTAIILLIEILRARKTAPVAAPPSEPAERSTHHIVAGVVVWTALYFLVFEFLGFIIATSIYLFVLMAYFNKGKWVANVLTAVLFSVGSYVMFVKLLGTNLAPGILPF